MGGPVSASTGRPCIAALDVGTSSVKACLFTPELNLLACSVREYRLRTENGRVEARAEDYLEAAAAGMREALDMAPGWRPAALGLTTQGETLVPVGRAGEPLGPFLVWLDSRAGAEAELLSGAFDRETFYRATGLPELSGALPLAKALWLRREEPEVFARTEKLLLLEDYLLHWLTGRLAGEKSLHTSTGWFHLGRDDLWEEALAAAGIPVGMLPELLDCGEPVGPLLPGPAEALGLPPGIPVATGAMDQTAAALAAGCVAPGAVTETTGTALVAAACTEAPVFAEGHHVTIYRHALAGKYLYLPIGNTAGMALRWFRDEFCRDLPADGGYAALDAQAAKVPVAAMGWCSCLSWPAAWTRTPAPRPGPSSLALPCPPPGPTSPGASWSRWPSCCGTSSPCWRGWGARSGPWPPWAAAPAAGCGSRSRPTCAAGPSPSPPALRPPPWARPCWPGGPGG